MNIATLKKIINQYEDELEEIRTRHKLELEHFELKYREQLIGGEKFFMRFYDSKQNPVEFGWAGKDNMEKFLAHLDTYNIKYTKSHGYKYGELLYQIIVEWPND